MTTPVCGDGADHDYLWTEPRRKRGQGCGKPATRVSVLYDAVTVYVCDGDLTDSEHFNVSPLRPDGYVFSIQEWRKSR